MPSWLRPEILEQGLTLTVIKYLSGKIKSIDSVKDLTWKEFFFIYFSEGAQFEKSNFFKKRMRPFLTMKQNKSGVALMQEIHKIIKEIPDTKDFFRKRIPITFAVTLCEHFWSCSHIWNDAKTKAEKRLILDKALELFATCTLEKDTLKSYWNMTEEFPEDRKIVHALIGSLIVLDTYQAYYLAKEIPFSNNQMTALVQKISEDKTKRVHVYECLILYAKTRYSLLVPLLQKLISEETNPQYILNHIEDVISGASEQEKESYRKSLFPLFDDSLRKVGIANYFNSKGSRVIDYLPQYEEGDAAIEGFLDEVIKYYDEHKYRLTFENFLTWYGYAPKQQFVELYLDGLGRHGYKVFQGAIAVFTACSDTRVLDDVIAKEIVKCTDVSEDLLLFIDWLEEQKLVIYYEKLQKTIIENNCLDRWLTNASGPSKHNLINCLKLATRFK